MYFFFSLIPATLTVVLGYFIRFSSTRTQGAVNTLGRILAIWVFVLAALPGGGWLRHLLGSLSVGLDDAVDAFRREHPDLTRQKEQVMKSNVGTADRAVRIVAGLVLLSLVVIL
ncbi:MAG TPA: YgaP-like transmembrane domain, partial [Burkholderiales bacterium]